MTETYFWRVLRRFASGLLLVVSAGLPAWAAGAEDIAKLEQQLAEQERTLGKEHLDVAYTLNELAVLYYSQEQYAKVEQLLQRTLTILEKQPEPDYTNMAATLNNLAELYGTQSRYAEAEALHRRALEIREKQLGGKYPDVDISLNNLAKLYIKQEQYAKAEPLYQRSQAIREKQLGTEHPDVAYTLNELAILYNRQTRYAEAELFYKRALAIWENQLGAEHINVAIALNNLALLYDNQSRHAEAEPLYKRALKIEEKILGTEHPDVATSLNRLARLYEDQARYSDAVPLLKRALAIRERGLGAEHPEVAVSLNNLAEIYRKLARHADAEQFFKRALGIVEKHLGENNFAVATIMNNLATLYHDQSRYAEAESLHKRALAITEKSLGVEHPDVANRLNNLAELYREQARYAEAEPLYRRALAIDEKTHGAEHPKIATSLNNLAVLSSAQARYADAELLQKRALAITEKTLGVEHPDVARNLNNLAELYREQARYADAEPLLKRAVATWEKALGENHPNVAIGLSNLALLYSAQAQYAKAEPLYWRALAIDEKAYGAEHPAVAAGLSNLAGLYGAQAQYEQAEPLQRRALEIREKQLGINHPSVAKSLLNLASLYNSQTRYADAEPLYKRALPIIAGSGEPVLLWGAYGNLRRLYAQSNPNLAVFYGKQSVNTLQGVRETNIAMDADSQQSFLKSKDLYYNELADQLFSQNRLTEGQQVLAMLKEAEYREFTGKAAADDPRRSRVAYTPREAKWNQRFEAIAAKLAKADPKSAKHAAAKKEMGAFFENVKKAFADGARGEVNRLDNTSPLQKPLAQLGEGTVLVQYLMPQERLWLLITTKDGMKAQQVDIKADALTQKIAAFQQAITTRSTDVNTLGKELHGLLIAPAAEDLQGAKTLMLAPDGALRYLPFAALHDGEQYLAQRYVLSNYTDMSKDRITDKPTANWSFAGFGVSKKVSDLHALPAVAGELAGIRANALDGTVRLDGDFTRESLQQALNSPPPVVHVASHFVFEKRGNEQSSYLLLGDGGKLTLADIRKDYRFNNVDLVALSACNTGVGGEDKDGREVEGLGVLVQRQGAKGVLASLWEVADESTGQFMQLFYSLRQRQGLSKAEALRQTQLAFIEGRVAAELTEAARARGRQTDASGKTVEAAGANHPYYWAPFILMGNWL